MKAASGTVNRSARPAILERGLHSLFQGNDCSIGRLILTQPACHAAFDQIHAVFRLRKQQLINDSAGAASIVVRQNGLGTTVQSPPGLETLMITNGLGIYD